MQRFGMELLTILIFLLHYLLLTFYIYLWNSIDSLRPLNAEVWGGIARRLGSKSSNCARHKKFQFVWEKKMVKKFCFQTHIVCWARWHCGGLRCWPGRPGEHSVHQPQTTGHWVEIFFSRQSYLNNDLRSKSWFFDKWNFISAKYLKCTSQSIRWLTTISWRHLKSSTSANRNGPL